MKNDNDKRDTLRLISSGRDCHAGGNHVVFPENILPMPTPKNCIICGGQPDIFGIYEPGPAVLPQSKGRKVAYGLCGSCFSTDRVSELAEQIIHFRLGWR